MAIFILKIEPQSEPPVGFTDEESLLNYLENCRKPFDFGQRPTSCPVIDALVDEAVFNDELVNSENIDGKCAQRERPRWIRGRINPSNIDSGEFPSVRHLELIELISDRGKECDHCGCMLGFPIGGPTLNVRVWKQGLERLIHVWMQLQRCRNPYVEFQIRLDYGDHEFPNRPKDEHLLIQFHADQQNDICSGDEDTDDEANSGFTKRDGSKRDDGDDEGDEFELVNVDFEETDCHLQKTGLENEKSEKEITDSKLASDSDIWQQLENLLERMTDEEIGELFKRVLLELFEAKESDAVITQMQSLADVPTSSSELAKDEWSIWDYVPIVGSIRSLLDASRSAKGGDRTGFIINSILGVGGLALDTLTVATGTVAIAGAVRIGAQVAFREMAKGVAKGMIKGAARQAAISGVVGAGVGGWKDGTSGALEGGMHGVMGGLASGGLSGGSRGAVSVGKAAIVARASAEVIGSALEASHQAVDVSRRAARVVKISAKIAKKTHERNRRAYSLLLNDIQQSLRNADTSLNH